MLPKTCDVSGKQEKRLFSRVGHLSGLWAADVFDEWEAFIVAHQHERRGVASELYWR